jgi:hypothetical protein
MKTLLSLISVLFLHGCNTAMLERVMPYERENLSKTEMSPTIQSERDTFATEVYAICEGVSLSSGGFVGGCGCK